MKVLYVLQNHFVLSESYVEVEQKWMRARGVTIESFSHRDGKPILGAIRAFRPDVVHVHWMNIAEAFLPDLARAGVPVTVRGHSFDVTESGIRKIAASPVVKRLWLLPPHMRAEYRPPIHPLPAFYDETLYRPNVFFEERQVMRAGAGLPGKGWDEMLEIARLAPDFKFLFVMTRPIADPGWPEANIAPKLPANVELRLDVPHEEVALLTRSSALYIRGFGESHAWAMPVSALEALASGCITLTPPAGQTIFGDAVLTYSHPGSAARQLYEVLDWDQKQWDRQRDRAIEAARPYRSGVVLPTILSAWKSIA